MSYSTSFVRWFTMVMVLLLSACGGADSGNPGDDDKELTRYTLSGTVKGLAGTGLVLQVNDEEYAVTTNGDFNLSIRVVAGTAYEVSVLEAPVKPNQNCTISPSRGVLTSDITDILLECKNNPFFVGNDVERDWELWQTDGTEAGTRLVKDIKEGYRGSFPRYMIDVAGILYFSADDGVHGRELWRSDGTAEGTYLVKDINTTPRYGVEGYSLPSELTVYNGVVYFRADDGVHGEELWKSDGTADGTVLVKDINPNGDSYPTDMIVYNDMLYFAADGGVNGKGLWRIDALGSAELVQLFSGWRPSNLTVYNGKLCFAADDGATGRELWCNDGTNEQTYLVKDINIIPTEWRPHGDSRPSNLTVFKDRLYFSANDGVNGRELWRSDGVVDGDMTQQVMDINPVGDSYPSNLTVYNGKLYFAARGEAGNELWSSDGIMTEQVKDINSGGSSYPDYLTVFKDRLYFSANDGEHGRELWRSDGTAEGTVLLKDINTGDVSFDPQLRFYDYVESQQVQSFSDGSLLFMATDATHGMELWKTDGTAEGTVRIKDINPRGDGVSVDYVEDGF